MRRRGIRRGLVSRLHPDGVGQRSGPGEFGGDDCEFDRHEARGHEFDELHVFDRVDIVVDIQFHGPKYGFHRKCAGRRNVVAELSLAFVALRVSS